MFIQQKKKKKRSFQNTAVLNCFNTKFRSLVAAYHQNAAHSIEQCKVVGTLWSNKL